MTRDEINKIFKEASPLKIYLDDVYVLMKKLAERGNSEMLFSGPPVNLTYEDWSSLETIPNMKEKFIKELRNKGFSVIDNSDERSSHKAITIRWK